MKKKTLFYLFIISFFSTSSVNSQISISPEIGVSYLPFTLYKFYGFNGFEVNSREINLLLGVSAQMPIHEKWNAKLRISYANRNDVEWFEVAGFDAGPGYDFEWKHQDLNIDLNFHYELFENVSVGMGPSLIRSFMERNRMDIEEGVFSRPLKENKFFFGLNASISLEIKRININLLYLRTRRYNKEIVARLPVGNNRIDFTVGYRIGKSK